MIHSIFAHAKRAGLIDENPAAGVRKFPGKSRTRRLDRNELRDLGDMLREVAETEHPVGLAVVRLLILSGMRLNEAQSLEREWVSEDGYIAFGHTKTSPQIGAIGSPALKLIQRQPVSSTSPYLFSSDGGKTHFIAADGVFGRICHRLGWSDVTPHTLRHSFASIAIELEYSERTIAGMLGHAAGSVTGGYVHIDQAVQSATDRVSSRYERVVHLP